MISALEFKMTYGRAPLPRLHSIVPFWVLLTWRILWYIRTCCGQTANEAELLITCTQANMDAVGSHVSCSTIQCN